MTAPADESNLESLIELAVKESGAGNHLQAGELLQRSYEIVESQKQHCLELRAKVLHLLANNCRDSGNLEQARQFYDKAARIFSTESFALQSMAFYDDLYIQALKQGDYNLALGAQLDLWKVLQEADGQLLKSKLRNVLRLAALCWTQSDYANADRHLREYLQLLVDVNDAPSNEYVSVLGYLGLIAFRQERLQEAESLYKEALVLLGNITDNEQAELLKQLGVVLCSQERHSEARVGCRKAEEIRREALDQTSEELRNIGGVYCAKNCFEEASKYCRAALDLVEMGCGADACLALAVILRRLGLVDDADLLSGRTGSTQAA
jgi:tetratricopeptide (TPR) repeat protein